MLVEVLALMFFSFCAGSCMFNRDLPDSQGVFGWIVYSLLSAIVAYYLVVK